MNRLRYEAAQLRVFAEMLDRGRIFRGLRPVYWSPSSVTALAEAELEYPEGHVSRAAYVAFPLHHLAGPGHPSPPSTEDPFAAILGGESRPAAAVIWTTTPWTIPANLALR
jgi:isoleucyl-tRNA synthetase